MLIFLHRHFLSPRWWYEEGARLMEGYVVSESSISPEKPVKSCLKTMFASFVPVMKTIPGVGTAVAVGEALKKIDHTAKKAVEAWQGMEASSGATSVGKIKEEPVELLKISDFWKPKAGTLAEGTLVSMTGQLSQYAPMVLGHPMQKREAHRAYRLSLSDEKQEGALGPTEVDALLACSAGQMVLRMEPNFPNVYLGLYHSIVRNSIPVFVNKDYYVKDVRKAFAKDRNVVEATIRGRVCSLPGGFLKAFVEEKKLMGRIGPKILSDMGAPILGIMVDGVDTSVKATGTSRYLDGDIWIALEHEGRQAIVSRFVDLADSGDIRREAKGLKADKDRFFKDWKVVLQFDQVDRLMSGYETSSTDEWIRELTSSPSQG
jgi:hypothetical protein